MNIVTCGIVPVHERPYWYCIFTSVVLCNSYSAELAIMCIHSNVYLLHNLGT